MTELVGRVLADRRLLVLAALLVTVDVVVLGLSAARIFVEPPSDWWWRLEPWRIEVNGGPDQTWRGVQALGAGAILAVVAITRRASWAWPFALVFGHLGLVILTRLHTSIAEGLVDSTGALSKNAWAFLWMAAITGSLLAAGLRMARWSRTTIEMTAITLALLATAVILDDVGTAFDQRRVRLSVIHLEGLVEFAFLTLAFVYAASLLRPVAPVTPSA